MTYAHSRPDAGAEISATVKWFDISKGYGFLVPEDDAPDIFCRASALTAVGLGTLLPGATVACETVQGLRGPEVSRILSVDFSTAAPLAASRARAPGNGAMAAGSGASGGAVRATVKWFDPMKGYGFLEREDGSGDLFCHMTAVQASGHAALLQGSLVTCEIAPGERGPQASRLLSVEPPAAGTGAAARRPSLDARYPGPQAAARPDAVMAISGAVRFFDPARGFGFVMPDGGGPEVFVHSSVLFRSGMTDLVPGQRVFVRAERAPRGLQARGIEPL